MHWTRVVRIICAVVLVLAVIGLGIEIWINDFGNLTVIRVCAYTAQAALWVQLGAALYALFLEHKKNS